MSLSLRVRPIIIPVYPVSQEGKTQSAAHLRSNIHKSDGVFVALHSPPGMSRPGLRRLDTGSDPKRNVHFPDLVPQ